MREPKDFQRLRRTYRRMLASMFLYSIRIMAEGLLPFEQFPQFMNPTTIHRQVFVASINLGDSKDLGKPKNVHLSKERH